MVAIKRRLRMVLLIVLAQGAVNAAAQTSDHKLDDQRRQECLSKGGRVAIVGLPQDEACVSSMRDAETLVQSHWIARAVAVFSI